MPHRDTGDGGVRDANVAIARSEIAAARSSRDQARDTAVKQVTDACDALHTSSAEYTAPQTGFDAAFDACRNDVGTCTDLVNDETAVSQAQSE
jgi:outer membrane protein TolC